MSRLSFIEAAARGGGSALVGPWVHRDGFDSKFEGMEVRAVGEEEAVATFTVGPTLCNAFGTLHGGAIATLVDIMGTLALLGRDSSRPGVSVDINVTYLSAGREGDRVTCVGRVNKIGRTLGFTEVRISGGDGKVIALGRHTKVRTAPAPPPPAGGVQCGSRRSPAPSCDYCAAGWMARDRSWIASAESALGLVR